MELRVKLQHQFRLVFWTAISCSLIAASGMSFYVVNDIQDWDTTKTCPLNPNLGVEMTNLFRQKARIVSRLWWIFLLNLAECMFTAVNSIPPRYQFALTFHLNAISFTFVALMNLTLSAQFILEHHLGNLILYMMAHPYCDHIPDWVDSNIWFILPSVSFYVCGLVPFFKVLGVLQEFRNICPSVRQRSEEEIWYQRISEPRQWYRVNRSNQSASQISSPTNSVHAPAQASRSTDIPWFASVRRQDAPRVPMAPFQSNQNISVDNVESGMRLVTRSPLGFAEIVERRRIQWRRALMNAPPTYEDGNALLTMNNTVPAYADVNVDQTVQSERATTDAPPSYNDATKVEMIGNQEMANGNNPEIAERQGNDVGNQNEQMSLDPEEKETEGIVEEETPSVAKN